MGHTFNDGRRINTRMDNRHPAAGRCGDQLWVPCAIAWFWYLAPLKLGRNFTHRIAVALEPPNDRRDLLGTGLRFSAIFRRKCSP